MLDSTPEGSLAGIQTLASVKCGKGSMLTNCRDDHNGDNERLDVSIESVLSEGLKP